jgi:hypothetical protein
MQPREPHKPGAQCPGSMSDTAHFVQAFDSTVVLYKARVSHFDAQRGRRMTARSSRQSIDAALGHYS